MGKKIYKLKKSFFCSKALTTAIKHRPAMLSSETIEKAHIISMQL